MAEHVAVPFAGEGSGTGELTWAQKGLWQTMREAGESRSLGGTTPLRPGTTVADVAATLGYVMGRHHSLRTRLRIRPDGTAEQVLATAGEAPLEIVDLPPGDDPAALAEAVRLRYQSVPFDYEREWPVRMAVVRRDGVLTHMVAVYLHLALDAYGLDVLVRDLLGFVSGAPVEPVTAVQPLELAARQATPAVLRQGAASLRHLEGVLRTVPAQRFPPLADPTAEPSWETLRFVSPALGLAVPAVAARRGIATSPVLLAAYAVGLGQVTGIGPALVMLAISNRFRPRLAQSVSPLAQIAPCVVEVADSTFDEVIGRAWQAAMTAYKHAYYDPELRAALIRQVAADRGGPVDTSCFLNDRRGQGLRLEAGGPAGDVLAPRPAPDLPASGAALRAGMTDALPRATTRWEHEPGAPRQKAYLDVDERPGAIELTLTADLRHLPRPRAEELVRAIEAAAVGMALDPDAATGVGGSRVAVR